MPRVALVDYGAGNLTSVRKALRTVDADVFVPATPLALRAADAVVIPGVGHFGATAALDGSWRAAVLASVESGHALLGICLGMQWLFDGSGEAPDVPGLGLLAGRSVLKLKGERGDKKRAHWQAVALAACEQCGRNRVPVVHEAIDLAGWMAGHPRSVQGGLEPLTRLMLSLHPDARPLREAVSGNGPVTLLSGPEGGLTPSEEAAALAAGFVPVTLGPRVLRAETAPLAVLAALTLG